MRLRFAPATMTRRFQGISFPAFIALSGFCGIVILAALGLFVARAQWEQSLERAEAEARSTAFFLSQHAEQIFTVADLALDRAILLVDEGEWDAIGQSDAAFEELGAIRNEISYLDDLWLNDASGALRLTSFVFPAPASNVSDRGAFRAQVTADVGLYVDKPITGRVTNKPTFLVSRRISDDAGRFDGIASATVALDYFEDFWKRLTLAPSMRITLFRAADMAVLTSWPDQVTALPDVDTFAAAREVAPVEGSATFAGAEGDRVGVYHRVGGYPIYVRVTQAQDAIARGFARRMTPLALAASLALLALAGLIGLSWRMALSEERVRLALNDEVRRRTADLLEETQTLDTLNRTGMQLAAELRLDAIVQHVVDSATLLANARYGAFFYLQTTSAGERLRLNVLAGASSDEFAHLGDPRATALFAPTFEGRTVVRSGDVTQDARYGGKLADGIDGGGMPRGHPKVRSYLAVPVVSRSGTDHGAILLGHPEPDRFGERHETLVRGLAAQAAIALDNAQLFEARAAAEARQRVLIDELNHRVKNMLATVKAVLRLSARSATDVDTFTATFTERLSSLAATHTILTDGMQQTAALHQLLEAELAPYSNDDAARVTFAGPEVELSSRIAVPLGMALHELTTNAAKHGSLSVPSGRLDVSWDLQDDRVLLLQWRERGGPPARTPTRRGFGSQLLQRVLVMQLGARCDFDYAAQGLRVEIELSLPKADPVGAAEAAAAPVEERAP